MKWRWWPSLAVGVISLASYSCNVLNVLFLSPLNNPKDPKATNYLAAPQQSSPSDNGTVTTWTPILSWQGATNAAKYEVELATAPTDAISGDFSASSKVISPDPMTTSSQYTVRTALSNNTVYYWRVRSVNTGGQSGEWSPTWSFTVLIPQVATPTFTPSSGSYSSDQSVAISCATPGATIYYTVAWGKNGILPTAPAAPTSSSTSYSGPISVSGDGTTAVVEAIAVESGMISSQTESGQFVINYSQVSTPNFSPNGGSYTTPVQVTITDQTTGATIYYTYTTNGTAPPDPTTSSPVYSSPINVSGTSTNWIIKAMATKSGMKNSTVQTSNTFSVNYPAAAEPTFSPDGGTYYSTSVTVTISSSAGASINYTTDGTTPTDTHGTPYAGPVTISTTNTMLQAIAYGGQYSDSPVKSATYVLQVSTPTLSPSAGTYFNSQSVTISDATAGATIYYTTDGTTPSTSSPVYGGGSIPVNVNSAPITIQAMGAVNGMTTSGAASGTYAVKQLAQWAQTDSASNALDNIRFNSVAVDSSGNIYAAGELYIYSGSVSFGNGVSVSGSVIDDAVIVKYNAAGAAQWAVVVSSSAGNSWFQGISVDSSGNICAAGILVGKGDTFSFGNGVTIVGSDVVNGMVVKYNSAGISLWAQTPVSGSDRSSFYGISVDGSDSIYASGYIGYSTSVNFGNGVIVAGSYTSNINAVVVKYNSSGAAQWARTPTSAGNGSNFLTAIADSSGNVYASGYVSGAGTFSFGNGVSASSGGSAGVVVKYNSSGSAQWAQTPPSSFNSAAIDTSGNVYLAGGAVVKYSPSGTVLWTLSVTGSGGPSFNSISLDGSGDIYLGGLVNGTSTTTFGADVHVAGAYTGYNALIVKLDPTDSSQWAQSVLVGPNNSQFAGVSADSFGNVYAAGFMFGASTFDFGNGMTSTGTGTGGTVSPTTDALVLKYAAQ